MHESLHGSGSRTLVPGSARARLLARTTTTLLLAERPRSNASACWPPRAASLASAGSSSAPPPPPASACYEWTTGRATPGMCVPRARLFVYDHARKARYPRTVRDRLPVMGRLRHRVRSARTPTLGWAERCPARSRRYGNTSRRTGPKQNLMKSWSAPRWSGEVGIPDVSNPLYQSSLQILRNPVPQWFPAGSDCGN